MDAAQLPAPQLGRILVAAGLLTEEQLAQALEEQARTGRRLGEIIVQRGFISGPALANALAEQHGGVLKTEYGFATGLGGDAAKRAASEASTGTPVTPVSPLRPPDPAPIPQLRTVAPEPASEEVAEPEPEPPAPAPPAPSPPPEQPAPQPVQEAPPLQQPPAPTPPPQPAPPPAGLLRAAEPTPPEPVQELPPESEPEPVPEPTPPAPVQELPPEPAPTPPPEPDPVPDPLPEPPAPEPVIEVVEAPAPPPEPAAEPEPEPVQEAAAPEPEPAAVAESDERDDLIESLRVRVEAQEQELATLRELLAQERARDEVQVHVWPEEQAAAPAAPAQKEHYLLCVPTPAGYVLLDRLGPLPSIGHAVDVPEEEGRFTVTKIVRLPRNGRPCAYLQRA